MQKDFHYDIIYALTKEAGYPHADANIIAYASQYVDDNTDREYTIYDSYDFYVGFPEEIGTSGNLYHPIITQAVDITAFKLPIQRYVFAPFHFIPGDNNVAINGKTNPLCTTRACKNATTLVKEALKSKDDPYRLGVALHTYADTFSHEKFSAFHEDWNRVHKDPLRNIPPNVGHGEVLHQPDEISTKWVDERFGTNDIDNRQRALTAAQNIFRLINKGKAKWNDVKSDFERFMNAKDSNERVKLVKLKYSAIQNYNEDSWINEALKFTRDASEIPAYDPLTENPQPTRARFVDTSVKDPNADWFRFQNAAKKQLATVLSMVDAL